MREESFASPFQPVTLSRSDSNELQVVSKTILDANLGRYRHFVDLDGGDVSLETWKPVQSIDQVQVFVERQSRSSFTPFQVNPAAEKSILQPLLCVGSIPGRLDDIMFSLVKSRVDASLRGNELSEAAVLSTLKAPTAAHPFQSIAVKWAELDVRLKSMGFVKNHDYIFIQATGVQRLLSGERVGYHLLHSIDLVKAPILPGRVRAQLSVCSFFRQATKTSVSLYSLGMMDSMGDRARRVVVPHFIKALLSTFKPVEGGRTRRLTKTLSKRYRGSFSRDDNCITCSKRAWPIRKSLTHGSTCNVCSGCVCNSCKVVKELSFMTPELEMIRRKVIFCSSCAVDENVSEYSFTESSGNSRYNAFV